MAASESRYRAFLDARAREGLRRSLLAVAARDARNIGAEGRSYINFASNDYLGLRFNQALIGRAVEWAETYGVGSGASRLVTGNLDLFAPIEAKVATLKGKPAALVMASGFQTNAAVLQALLDRSRARRRATRLRRPPQSRQHAFRLPGRGRAAAPLPPWRRVPSRRASESISRG